MTTTQPRLTQRESSPTTRDTPDGSVASGAAFDALYVEHHGAIFRLLYGLMGAHQDAEDLTQECFLRLHARPHLWQPDRANNPCGQAGGSGEHNVRGWLYQVATRLAYNSLRAGRRRDARQEAFSASPMQASPEDPGELAERAELRRCVRQALARLPRQQMQLLMLRHAGFSYRELAGVLGVAPGSVGTMLARASVAFERAYREIERPAPAAESPEGG